MTRALERAKRVHSELLCSQSELRLQKALASDIPIIAESLVSIILRSHNAVFRERMCKEYDWCLTMWHKIEFI